MSGLTSAATVYEQIEPGLERANRRKQRLTLKAATVNARSMNTNEKRRIGALLVALATATLASDYARVHNRAEQEKQ
jgi:hypothetical protein